MSLAAPTTRRPVLTHTLGFPRMGAQRALKFALESFWRGDSTEAELEATAAQLRQLHWQAQADAGLGCVTVGDFALYDHVANHIQLLGCEPARVVGSQALGQGFQRRARGGERLLEARQPRIAPHLSHEVVHLHGRPP